MPFRRRWLWGVLGLILLFSARGICEESARLTIQSEPAGATVYLDGQELGVTTPVRLNVSPGTHTIRLTKPGFRETTRTVEVAGDGFVHFALISLSSSSPSAEKTVSSSSPSRSSPIEPHSSEKTATAEPITVNIPYTPPTSVPSSRKEEMTRKEDLPPAPVQKKNIPGPAPVPPSEPEATGPEKGDSVNAEEQPPALPPIEKETLPSHTLPEGAQVSGVPPCLTGDSVSEEGTATCFQPPEIEWPESAEGRMAKAAENLPRFPERFNVLLLGLDRRDRYGILATGAEIPEEKLKKMSARSDVIMVAQLDFAEKQIRLVSIPRDTQVRVRGSLIKINAAYTYGREALAKRTVEDFFNIKIHRVVTVDWRGAKKAIAMFKNLGLDYHGFSEKEIFWHLRKRSFQGGDFHRIERQQLFLRYALGEYLRLYNETRESQGTAALVKRGLLELAIKEGLSVVETDLTFEELQILSFIFRDYDVRRMTLAQVHGSSQLAGEDSESKVYVLNPTRRHSFNDIIARVEKPTN